ncbi:MAG: GntR family transcriptional regulator [Nocardioidaceae bacterium]
MQPITSTRDSLTQQVYRALLEAIVSGELAPGSLHSVGKLAELLEVSRSPVREALIMLTDQGMVAFERNRGVRIQQTTAHELEEVFSVRLLLEVPAAYRAAKRMQPADVELLERTLGTVEEFVSARSLVAHQERDLEFHRVLLDGAGNRRLSAVVDQLWTYQQLRGVSTAGRSRGLADIHREHEAIYQRVAAGDPHGAAAAMRTHLVNTGRLLVAQETGRPTGAELLDLPWLEVYDALGGAPSPD